MLKKRLIGMVTVKNGWAVQSMGYKRYLPLGKPECLIENLDRWGVDEILVQVIDRAMHGGGPDFVLLEKIARLGLETPLIYGGGICTIQNGVLAIQAGADRLVVDALLHDEPSIVHGLSERLGAQAIIAVLPVARDIDRVEWLDYRTGRSSPISTEVISLIETGAVSEILLIDWRHEGYPHAFDQGLASNFPLKNVPLIVFGGISDSIQIAELLQMKNVVAATVGNFLNYREHAAQKLKEALFDIAVRSPAYEAKYSSFSNV